VILAATAAAAERPGGFPACWRSGRARWIPSSSLHQFPLKALIAISSEGSGSSVPYAPEIPVTAGTFDVSATDKQRLRKIASRRASHARIGA